jgi:putative phage-type endonuclease
MAKIDVIQGSPEWHEYRRKKIGGSSAPTIMGLNRFQTAHELWEEMVGLREPQKENEAMREGKRLEPIARKIVEEGRGIVFPEEVHDLGKYPHIYCSYDGINHETEEILEIKSSVWFYSQAEKTLVPESVNCQIQHGLMVAGYSKGIFAACHPQTEKVITIGVERDNEFIAAMFEKELEFYECVTTFREPKLTDADYLNMQGNDEWKLEKFIFEKFKEEKERIEKSLEASRNRLASLAGNRNARGHGLTLTKVLTKGRVKYDDIPALQRIDLDLFRGDPTTSFRLTVGK